MSDLGWTRYIESQSGQCAYCGALDGDCEHDDTWIAAHPDVTPSWQPPTECDRCDGCGWYEGGKSLRTACEDCGGTGVVMRRTPATPRETR